jgi:GntR family transcriptional regulator, transcriptional repressor for pyruvate dehydrogenase complex
MSQPVTNESIHGMFRPKGVVRPRVQVEEQIRAAILSGELPAGHRLQSEAELARLFGVSRNTVREGLRSLETQGLISKIPGAGGGSFVQAVDQQSLSRVLQESVGTLIQLGTIGLDDLSALRQYLEVPSARLAAERRSAEDIEALRSIVERQQALLDGEVNDAENRELNLEFHNTVARVSGNALLNTFVSATHQASTSAQYVTMGQAAWESNLAYHRDLVTAIANREPDKAESVMRAHLNYVRANISQAIDGPRLGSE